MELEPVAEQVVVVLGASSGIGRASALRLAERGARLVVATRSEPGLQSLVQEIADRGGQGTYVVCDVVDADQVQAVAETAVSAYGRIGTWVNVAAVLVHAPLEQTLPEEFRRVMEINYLGQVHGVLAALPRLREAGGGALITVCSVESRVALPRHSACSASKHAVEGMADALRRDLLAGDAPISVTSIKPATINTPFFTSAAHILDVEPTGPPPIYQPSVVAVCVLQPRRRTLRLPRPRLERRHVVADPSPSQVPAGRRRDRPPRSPESWGCRRPPCTDTSGNRRPGSPGRVRGIRKGDVP